MQHRIAQVGFTRNGYPFEPEAERLKDLCGHLLDVIGWKYGQEVQLVPRKRLHFPSVSKTTVTDRPFEHSMTRSNYFSVLRHLIVRIKSTGIILNSSHPPTTQLSHSNPLVSKCLVLSSIISSTFYLPLLFTSSPSSPTFRALVPEQPLRKRQSRRLELEVWDVSPSKIHMLATDH